MLKLFAMDGGVVEIGISFSWQVEFVHFPPPESKDPSPLVEEGGESIFDGFTAPVVTPG